MTQEKIEVVVDNGEKSDQKSKTKRRRRRGNQTKNGNQNIVKKVVVVKSKKNKGANRRNKAVFGDFLSSKYELTDAQKGYIHLALDPCGEYHTQSECSKIPDSATPNSFPLLLREAISVFPPGTDSSTNLSLDGKNWSLTILSIPLFRHPLILIADVRNREFSSKTEASICRALSSIPDVESCLYPNWVAFGFDSDIYFSIVAWEVLRGVPSANSSGSPILSQFRITSKGMSVFFNTPTLINQGMVMGAQWNSGQASVTESFSSRPNDLHNVTLEVTMNPTLNSVTIFYGPYYQIWRGITSNSTIMTLQPTQGGISTSTWGTAFNAQIEINEEIYTIPQNEAAIRFTLTTLTTNNPVQGAFQMEVLALDPLDPDEPPSYIALPTMIGVVSSTSPSTIEISVPVVFSSIGDIELNTTSLVLPPLNYLDIVQSTPKAVVTRAVEGMYMPHRFFQPIANLQESTTAAPVKFRKFSDDPNQVHTASNFFDAADRNLGCGVVAFRGISWSANPFIKLFSTVEGVASEGSPYMAFMGENKVGEQSVFEIVRDIGETLPFGFPESYNFLGKLASMVTGIVGQIPIVGNLAKPVLNAVDRVISGFPYDTNSRDGVQKLKKHHALMEQRIHEICGTLSSVKFSDDLV
jgi:hypothetical protein